MPRTGILRALLAAAVLVSGCGTDADDDGGTPKPGAALVSRVQGFWTILGPPAGAVALYNADIVRATEPIELVSARPESLPPGTDLLSARTEFLRRSGPGPTTEDLPGGSCTEQWPPEGYGTTEPVEGLKLKPGERVAIHFYVRTDGKPSETRGVVVTYRGADGVVRQQTLEGVTLQIEPDEATVCSGLYQWFQIPAQS